MCNNDKKIPANESVIVAIHKEPIQLRLADPDRATDANWDKLASPDKSPDGSRRDNQELGCLPNRQERSGARSVARLGDIVGKARSLPRRSSSLGGFQVRPGPIGDRIITARFFRRVSLTVCSLRETRAAPRPNACGNLLGISLGGFICSRGW
jgi:hypothetical protein